MKQTTITDQQPSLPRRSPLGRKTFTINAAAETMLQWRDTDPERWAAIKPASKIWLAFYEALRVIAEEQQGQLETRV